MGSFEATHLNLECGGNHRSSAVGNDDDEEESVCFSDEGSCYSQFYSTANGSDDCNFDQVSESRRVSSVVGSDCSVDIENEVKVFLERDCRICQMSLEVDGSNDIAIELGCCCKNDLAAAHQHCAETWFKIKGNKICEICNSVARNVVGLNYDIESPQQIYEPSSLSANAASARVSSTSATRPFITGPRFLNCLLACIVFAFVVSWLFDFKMPQ